MMRSWPGVVGFVACGLLFAGCDSASSNVKKAEEGAKKAAREAKEVAKEAVHEAKEAAHEAKEAAKEAVDAAKTSVLKPIEAALPKLRIEEAAARTQARIDACAQAVIGVNRFVETEESPLATGDDAILTVPEHVEAEQIARLNAWREQRDDAAVAAALAELTRAADENRNIMPASIACAKAGVLALTTSLAVEWAKYHLRINAIAPCPFPTEGAWSRLIPSKRFEEHALNKHPMRRFGKHEELTNLAAFLLSDMAEYINGECVVIDGGQWLRGSGEFNDLAILPDETWEQIETARANAKK